MKNWIVVLSVVFLILTVFNSPSQATPRMTPLTTATQEQLIRLRAAIKNWAPICNGAMALSKVCYQFDIVEYAGYLCALGDQDRCEDVRKSQDPETGRWWRAPTLVGKTTSDSFSRDMFMGLMFYFAATKDRAGLKKWMDYLSANHNKMCPDGSDNRCSIEPSNWGMLGYLYRYLGMKPTALMKFGMVEMSPETIISAITAPRGFELALFADNLFFLRFIHVHTHWMNNTAKIMLARQPNNPMFRYLVHGSTEELAQDLIRACPATPTEEMGDFAWSRQIGRDPAGNLTVIRSDFPAPVPVNVIGDGHDCITALDFVISSPF